jgi:hypothetical protein
MAPSNPPKSAPANASSSKWNDQELLPLRVDLGKIAKKTLNGVGAAPADRRRFLSLNSVPTCWPAPREDAPLPVLQTAAWDLAPKPAIDVGKEGSNDHRRYRIGRRRTVGCHGKGKTDHIADIIQHRASSITARQF